MNDELYCTWLFGPESGADDGPNDALAENFNSKPTISLVRETIQNSLDAAPENSSVPVRVEYTFDELPIDTVPNLLEIREHIEGCLKLYADNDNALEYFPPMIEYLNQIGDSIPYIKVSDSNTTGMNYVDDYHTKEPFYAFVRSKGVTVKKSASSGGSFGFGKAAYFGMSKLKTVLVSTRTSEGKAFFQGVASLCTHVSYNENDGKLAAVGYYDNNDGKPIDDEDLIPGFFVREKEKPGTDFWIMGYDKPQKESIKEEMIIATLRSFWLSILKGDLIVVIDGNEITAENLPDYMRQYFPEENDRQTSNRENFNPRPYMEAVLHGEEEDNPRFRCVTKTLNSLGEVKLYAFLSKQGSNKVMLTRKPKMLVQLKPVSPIGISAVFVCENEEGNKLLKRMENPTHSLWLAGRKHDTKAAYQELDKFLTDTITGMRPVSGKKSLQVMGLSDLVWIPESLMPEDVEADDESENGSLRLTSEIQDEEGGNQVALVQKIATKTAIKKKSSVQEEDQDAADILDDGDNTPYGEEGSGGGPSDNPNPFPPNPGPFPTPVPGPNPGPNPGPTPAPDPDGGNTGEKKPRPKKKTTEVRMRQRASVVDGKLVHTMNIYPPRDIEKATLSLFVSWDEGYSKQPIRSAQIDGVELNVVDNRIVEIPLSQKGTKITVRFFDNIKHAIKLSVEDESN